MTEADTLMIRCIKLGSDSVQTNVVSVYSADTDVFFLLLFHSNQLNCSSLFIRLVKGFVDIKLLRSILGDGSGRATSALSLGPSTSPIGPFHWGFPLRSSVGIRAITMPNTRTDR